MNAGKKVGRAFQPDSGPVRLESLTYVSDGKKVGRAFQPDSGPVRLEWDAR
jgi:hypothetical protein